MSKILKRVTIILLILITSGVLFFKLSPYPRLWLIRYAFNKDAVDTNEKLNKFVPQNIKSLKDIQYDPEDKNAFMDVYYPSDAGLKKKKLPLIVWVHGGGLISGSKNHIANYSKILASNQYTVISIDYTVAPEAKYPTPIKQLNKALSFISLNPELLNVDTSRIFLAGDSGGSMIVATAANTTTNANYAKKST